MSDKVHFVITGGTIDSYYEGTKDTAVPLKESSIPNLFNLIKPYNDVVFTQVCMKDSRDLDKNDMKQVLDVIEKSKQKKIIVTHGTYTMPDTARYLEANLKRKDQVIILTGSIIPISGFSPSDGPFNLGFAFAKLFDLKPGIYVSMNARIFSPKEVIKVSKEGKFSSIIGE